MQTLRELGEAVANRRHELRLCQAEVASLAQLSSSTLSKFERGRLCELGTRKLLGLLAALGMEISLVDWIESGSLDDLLIERGGGSHGVRGVKETMQDGSLDALRHERSRRR